MIGGSVGESSSGILTDVFAFFVGRGPSGLNAFAEGFSAGLFRLPPRSSRMPDNIEGWRGDNNAGKDVFVGASPRRGVDVALFGCGLVPLTWMVDFGDALTSRSKLEEGISWPNGCKESRISFCGFSLARSLPRGVSGLKRFDGSTRFSCSSLGRF